MTFKEYMAEQQSDAETMGRKFAAEFLNTSITKLHLVAKDLEEKVLDTGKELKHKFTKMGIGNLVVRLYSAFGKLFARVEIPSGDNFTFEAT